MGISGAETIPVEVLWWVIPVVIWDVVWKAIALWHAARNGQKGWFAALLVVNSMGILPIVYLRFFCDEIGNNPGIRK